jgi:hypothetical protein
LRVIGVWIGKGRALQALFRARRLRADGQVRLGQARPANGRVQHGKPLTAAKPACRGEPAPSDAAEEHWITAAEPITVVARVQTLRASGHEDHRLRPCTVALTLRSWLPTRNWKFTSQERGYQLRSVIAGEYFGDILTAKKYNRVSVLSNFLVGLSSNDRSSDEDAKLSIPYARDKTGDFSNAYCIRSPPISGGTVALGFKRELCIDGSPLSPSRYLPIASRPPSTAPRVISSTITRWSCI